MPGRNGFPENSPRGRERFIPRRRRRRRRRRGHSALRAEISRARRAFTFSAGLARNGMRSRTELDGPRRRASRIFFGIVYSEDSACDIYNFRTLLLASARPRWHTRRGSPRAVEFRNRRPHPLAFGSRKIALARSRTANAIPPLRRSNYLASFLSPLWIRTPWIIAPWGGRSRRHSSTSPAPFIVPRRSTPRRKVRRRALAAYIGLFGSLAPVAPPRAASRRLAPVKWNEGHCIVSRDKYNRTGERGVGRELAEQGDAVGKREREGRSIAIYAERSRGPRGVSTISRTDPPLI